MVKRIVYRTDTEDFQAGRVLRPRGDHIATMNAMLHEAERLLRKGKVGGDKIRSNCVYVWETLEAGESNWSHDKEKHLYELEICDADILHRGDSLFLATLAAVSDNHQLATLIQEYWNVPAKGKYVELMVRRARVTKKLKDKFVPRPNPLGTKFETNEQFDARVLGHRIKDGNGH
jgi:hypothetical protein